MEFDTKDQEVVELLTKLKDANGAYPQDLLASRRKAYLNQMAGLGLGTGLGTALKDAAKNGNGAGFTPPTAGTLLEVILVVALIAEAGTLAFFYRSRIAEVFKSTAITPSTEEVISPPVSTFSFPTLVTSDISISPIPTGVAVTEPAIEIAASTATAAPPDTSSISSPVGATQILTNSTPNPSANDANNGNNGNHYGQTPKPERTKENGSNNAGNEGGDNHPKDDKDKNN